MYIQLTSCVQGESSLAYDVDVVLEKRPGETLRKLYIFTKFPHQKIRWSFGILRSNFKNILCVQWCTGIHFHTFCTLWKTWLQFSAEASNWNTEVTENTKKLKCPLKLFSIKDHSPIFNDVNVSWSSSNVKVSDQ